MRKFQKILLKISKENIKKAFSYKMFITLMQFQKELQKDKTYDRVVISEDLENFTNNQYDQIDKLYF